MQILQWYDELVALTDSPVVRLKRAGDLGAAARVYAEAATLATNVAERSHLTRQAARLRQR